MIELMFEVHGGRSPLLLGFGLWLVKLENVGYGAGWVQAALGLFIVVLLLGGNWRSTPKACAQRAAIIAWRTRLQVVADQLGVRLPDDIQLAGRGEIPPSPLGS